MVHPDFLHFDENRERLQEILKGQKEPERKGSTLMELAGLFHRLGYHSEARQAYEQAATLFKDAGLKREQAIARRGIAQIALERGESDHFLQIQSENVEILQSINDERAAASVQIDMARILTQKGLIDRAIRLLEKAVEAYQLLNDWENTSEIQKKISEILLKEGEVDRALLFMQDRRASVEALGDRKKLVQCLFNKYVIEYQAEHLQEDQADLAEAYEIALELEDCNAICNIGLRYGRLLLHRQEILKGIEVLGRAANGFRQAGQPELAQDLDLHIQWQREQFEIVPKEDDPMSRELRDFNFE